MKPAPRRVGGALVAALLVAPLGTGIAAAEPLPEPTTPVEEVTPGTGEETTDPGTEDPAEDPTTDPGTDEGDTSDPGTTDPATDEGATEPDATDPATPTPEETTPEVTTPEETAPDETVTVTEPAAVTSLEMDYSFLPSVDWLPSGTYTTRLRNLSAAGNTADGRVDDLAVTWSYTLNDGQPVTFVPVDGATTVPGLRTGENTLVLQASYTNPAAGTSDPVQVFVEPTVVTTSVTLPITGLSMAETVALLDQDTVIPNSSWTAGASGSFRAPAGFFAPGEPVTVTLVPTDGSAPVTLTVGSAAADGSFVFDATLAADLAAGTYYVVAESPTTAGYSRVSVSAAPAVVAGGTSAVADPTAVAAAVTAATPAASTSGTTRLATTGTDPSTGLLVGGLVTLVGAGAVLGARKLRSARAQG
ncbi:MAG TPA: hypothetical protein VGC57_04430 [Cellulomonas sp.]